MSRRLDTKFARLVSRRNPARAIHPYLRSGPKRIYVQRQIVMYVNWHFIAAVFFVCAAIGWADSLRPKVIVCDPDEVIEVCDSDMVDG